MSSMKTNEIEDRFFVRGRMEILHVLNDLIHRHEPVTVHFPDAGGHLGHLEVRLLEARDPHLIFEAGNETALHQRLLGATDCAFVASPDGIRVQFSGHPVQRIDLDDSSVFAIPMPEMLARLQRQETFRIRIPAEKALQVQLSAGDGADLGIWPLHDLSAGGLGVSVSRDSSPELVKRIARASFTLPEHGPVDCAVALRHTTGMLEGSTADRYRIGVAFTGLPLETRVAIQRYIINMEHERRHETREHETDAPR